MENIKIILSDLDGTLFKDDKSISDFSKRTILAAQKKGILFGISTARAIVNAQRFLEGISPDIMISNGGGMVLYKGKKIYNEEFSLAEVTRLIESAFEVFGKDVTISADNERGFYSNSREELGDKFWNFTDFLDFNQPAMKFCIKTLDREKVLSVASRVGLEQVDILPFSDIPWYKLSKKSATKEKAIEALCSHLGFKTEEIAAFGDDFNDIGMLTLCGRGLAMKNAIQEVKDCAGEICLSNEEDGVARWIEKNIL